MTTETNPQPAGVEQGSLSIEQRLANLYGGAKPAPAPAPKPVEEAAPEAPDAVDPEQDAAPSEELTPDDLPDEADEGEAQPASADEFEIVHNGTQHKLDRAKVIELAQKGFDYTAKTQQLAQAQQQATLILQAAQETAQIRTELANEMAAVKAAEQALAPWQRVDWVQLATNEPLEYPKYWAQYQQLLGVYQQAAGTFQQKANFVDQRTQMIAQAVKQQETQKLAEMIPSFRDPAKAKAESTRLYQAGLDNGYTPEELDSIMSAKFVKSLWKIAEYDRLVKSKSEHTKQMRQAPPTARPGAIGTTQSAEAKKSQQLRQNLKKSGDWRDAAALLARRMK